MSSHAEGTVQRVTFSIVVDSEDPLALKVATVAREVGVRVVGVGPLSGLATDTCDVICIAAAEVSAAATQLAAVAARLTNAWVLPSSRGSDLRALLLAAEDGAFAVVGVGQQALNFVMPRKPLAPAASTAAQAHVSMGQEDSPLKASELDWALALGCDSVADTGAPVEPYFDSAGPPQTASLTDHDDDPETEIDATPSTRKSFCIEMARDRDGEVLCFPWVNTCLGDVGGGRLFEVSSGARHIDERASDEEARLLAAADDLAKLLNGERYVGLACGHFELTTDGSVRLTRVTLGLGALSTAYALLTPACPVRIALRLAARQRLPRSAVATLPYGHALVVQLRLPGTPSKLPPKQPINRVSCELLASVAADYASPTFWLQLCAYAPLRHRAALRLQRVLAEYSAGALTHADLELDSATALGMHKLLGQRTFQAQAYVTGSLTLEA